MGAILEAGYRNMYIVKKKKGKMATELPCQRNCLACLMPQIFGVLKQDKITFGLGLKQPCVPKNCQDNKEADMTTRLITTGQKIKNI